MNKDLTHEILTQYLNYDPNTGKFVWIKSPHSNIKIGDEAGSKTKEGYYRISLLKKEYRRARLAWFYVNKEWPQPTIDHINRVKSDDRICNLRIATYKQQQYNLILIRKNRLLPKHIDYVRGKYRVRIKDINNKRHFASFDSLEEAKEYANNLREKLHANFAYSGEGI